jgi:hypothetical protein
MRRVGSRTDSEQRAQETSGDERGSRGPKLPIDSAPVASTQPTKPALCRNCALNWCRGIGDHTCCCSEQVVTAVGADGPTGHRLHARARGSECTSAVRARLRHRRRLRGRRAGPPAVAKCRSGTRHDDRHRGIMGAWVRPGSSVANGVGQWILRRRNPSRKAMSVACSAASLGARSHRQAAWNATASSGGSCADVESATRGRTSPTPSLPSSPSRSFSGSSSWSSTSPDSYDEGCPRRALGLSSQRRGRGAARSSAIWPTRVSQPPRTGVARTVASRTSF